MATESLADWLIRARSASGLTWIWRNKTVARGPRLPWLSAQFKENAKLSQLPNVTVRTNGVAN